jgi:hypothetical protein
MRTLVDDIPAYTAEGQDAIELLYLDYASFFFYFEDAHHESVYERFIERLFPKITGFVVICLGGKTKVLAKAKEGRFPGVKSIFIVDSDYDSFPGKVEKIPDVFHFEKISFENYLIKKMLLLILVSMKTAAF